eukprot:6483396-Amphidinium_carterae.1
MMRTMMIFADDDDDDDDDDDCDMACHDMGRKVLQKWNQCIYHSNDVLITGLVIPRYPWRSQVPELGDD